jgi:cytochrome b561
VIFVILGALFQFTHLQLAAFYNMIFVVIAMPMVLFSGYVDWQKRYDGNMTPVFMAKMVCGVLVTLAALIVVIWQAVDPNVAGPGSASRAGFIFLHVLMLAAAGTAGFLGGKLVFKD